MSNNVIKRDIVQEVLAEDLPWEPQELKEPDPHGYEDEAIQLVFPGITQYITRGNITGKDYEFKGAGSVVMVNAVDVPEMLSRTREQGCCGSPVENLAILKRI